MTKNIIQLHERVKFWMDISRNARFHYKLVDAAINVAIDSIIKNRFIPNTLNNKEGVLDIRGFERTKNIRDELVPLVKKKEITVSSNTLLFSDQNFPADYAYYTLIELEINGTKFYPAEIDQERLRSLKEDPFARPSTDFCDQTYFQELSDGFTFFVGGSTVSKVTLYYLGKQTTVFYGFEKTLVNITNGKDIIISQNSCTLGGVSMNIGTKTTRPASLSTEEQAILAVYDWVDSNMPDVLFDEIAQRAAETLLLTVGKTIGQQQPST